MNHTKRQMVAGVMLLISYCGVLKALPPAVGAKGSEVVDGDIGTEIESDKSAGIGQDADFDDAVQQAGPAVEGSNEAPVIEAKPLTGPDILKLEKEVKLGGAADKKSREQITKHEQEIRELNNQIRQEFESLTLMRDLFEQDFQEFNQQLDDFYQTNVSQLGSLQELFEGIGAADQFSGSKKIDKMLVHLTAIKDYLKEALGPLDERVLEIRKECQHAYSSEFAVMHARDVGQAQEHVKKVKEILSSVRKHIASTQQKFMPPWRKHLIEGGVLVKQVQDMIDLFHRKYALLQKEHATHNLSLQKNKKALAVPPLKASEHKKVPQLVEPTLSELIIEKLASAIIFVSDMIRGLFGWLLGGVKR